jgi:hypothetical protein
MREVEVFDRNGVNVALNKTANQSSTIEQRYASLAVNGNTAVAEFTHTDLNAGKYHLSIYSCASYSIY